MGRKMVEIPVPPEWKRLWNTWDLRGFIILSISLQTFLIFFAPLRKRIKSIWITMFLWSAYLLADWAANFAVGLISNSQGNPSSGSKKNRTPVENGELLAFWAPFLLVHLGGPDTITAFSLEDNELWLRHLLGLVFQCVAAIYVFVQSLPHNRLWIPTMFVFINGVIKYSERTRSLYLASADRFKDSMLSSGDPGPNYAKLMSEYNSMKGKLPTRIQMVQEPDRSTKSAKKAKRGKLTDLEVVQYGYHFFNNFKGLIVDMIFTRKERDHSRYFFLQRTAYDAFRVVEVELNFIYDVLFTKVPVVFDKYGRWARFISLFTLSPAIVLFILESKSNYSKTDVTITYGLLFGAFVLDMVALFMLLFSDWTIIKLRESPDLELDKYLLTIDTTILVNLVIKCMPWDTTEGNATMKQFHMKRVLTQRWSNSISTYNLIHYCLHPRSKLSESVLDKFGVKDFLDKHKYVKSKDFAKYGLRNFIFDELKSKAELGDDLETAKEISSARGDWVLRVEEGWSSLLKYVQDVDYDQSLILWHIATELCYNYDDLPKPMTCNNDNDDDPRQIAKLLSDYMLYLLIMQPRIMSAVAGIGQIRFKDTCAEIKQFFLDEKVYEEKHENQSSGKRGATTQIDLKQKSACKRILDVPTEVPPVTIKGDSSKSLLFDSCILAKELINIEKVSKLNNKNLDKWKIISKVWVELLCYAASHSRANTLAAQVSEGGELITIVWLLMAHFGLGEQFQINEGQGRAKLIVGK